MNFDIDCEELNKNELNNSFKDEKAFTLTISKIY